MTNRLPPTLPLDESDLIAIIYQAASDPGHWPKLLEVLYQLTLHPTSSASISRIEQHLTQALSITRRINDLEDKISIFDELMDRVPIGLLLVNSRGQIIQSNQLAEDALKEEGFIQRIGEQLVACNAKANKELILRIKEVSGSTEATAQSRGIALPHHNIRHTQAVAIVTPLLGHLNRPLDSQGMVLIFVSANQDKITIELAAFADIYQLTPKEMRIAEHIVQGLSPQDIAQKFHVSYNTVRSQLKSVFQKTQTNKQSELVNLVLSGPGGMLFQTSQVQQINRAAPPQQRLRLRDDRTMNYQEHGDPNGHPVIYCHSTMGTRLKYFFKDVDWALRLKIRLISPERPGYGYSDPNIDSNFIHWSEDLVQLLDELKIDQVSLIGNVAGCTYAATCATMLKSRIKQLVLISPMIHTDNPDEINQTAPLFRMHLMLAKSYPELHQPFIAILKRSIHKDPSNYFSMMTEKMSPEESEPFNNRAFRDQYLSTLRDASRQGEQAFSKDIVRISRECQFNPEDITCPITIWHGDVDAQSPLLGVRRFYAKARQMQLQVIPGQNQFLIYQHWPDILAKLAHDLT